MPNGSIFPTVEGRLNLGVRWGHLDRGDGTDQAHRARDDTPNGPVPSDYHALASNRTHASLSTNASPAGRPVDKTEGEMLNESTPK